jgi:hypothetical protein
MKRAISGLVLVAGAALALAAGMLEAASARPIVPAERRYSSFSGDVPACDDPAVLRRITDRFHQKEAEFWNSSLEIEHYDRIGQIGFRTNGLDYIPRRFCRARAYINDNRNREVVYSIGEDQGMIGVGFGVTWCVIGLDRNWAYGPACRAAYP